MLPKKFVLLGGNPKSSLDMDYSKTPQIDPRLTWARSVTGSVVDQEGLNRTAKANEARFTGARRVENLLTFSEDFSNAAWAQSGTTRTVSSIISNGLTSAHYVSQSVSLTQAKTFNVTFEVKYGTARYLQLFPDGAADTQGITFDTQTGTAQLFSSPPTPAPTWGVLALSDGWFKFSMNFKSTSSSTVLLFSIVPAIDSTRNLVSSVTGAINIRKAQLIDATGQANQNPSEYVSSGVLSYPYHGAGVDGVKYFATTNGNTVTNNVVTEGVGTPLTGITLLCEEARTNLLIYSNFDVPRWGPEFTVVTNNSTTSPDGTVNATKLDETAFTNFHDAYKQLTLADATVYTYTVYAKKGERDWFILQVQTNTATFVPTFFNVNTGVIGTIGAGITASISPSSNGFYRCRVTYTNTGAVARYVYVGIALADNVASYLGVANNGLYIYGAQLEAAPNASSYIPTTTAAVTRTADVPSFTGAGLNWYNAQQGTFVVKASGQYASAPGNIGVWNPLLTGEGSYAITYDKSKNNNAYLYLPNAAAGVNPLEYQDIPTPTIILLGEQGILNISRWTYYPKAFKANKVMGLVSGTLTTSFDVSYAETTNFTNLFRDTSFPYGTRAKAFPKINTSSGITFIGAWKNDTSLVSFPLIDTSNATNFTSMFYGYLGTSIKQLNTIKVTSFNATFTNSGLTSLPLLNTAALTDATDMVAVSVNLSVVPPNFFDNAKCKLYLRTFNGCALTQQSVDNILVSIRQSVINTPTLTGGTLNMTGGTSSAPSAVGIAAKDDLVNNYSWTVTVNP